MQPSDDDIRAMLAGAEKRPTPWLNVGGENAIVTDSYMMPVAYYVPSSLRPLLSAAPDLAALALSRGEALAKAEAENARLRAMLDRIINEYTDNPFSPGPAMGSIEAAIKELEGDDA